MNDFNFLHLRPYDRKRTDSVQETVRHNIGPRQLGVPGGPHQTARGARFSLGSAVPTQTVFPQPVPIPPEDLPPIPPPLAPATEPQRVFTGWGGAGIHQFQFFSATPAAAGNNEIRVSEFMPFGHIETKALWITPYSGVSAGQFLQVFWSHDNDITPSANPSGSLIGLGLGRLGDNPGIDNTRAFPIPLAPINYDAFRTGAHFEGYLKLRLFFVAPAVALPVISVAISIYYEANGFQSVYAVRS